MRYEVFYNLLDGFEEPNRFYDEQTIRRFRVYPATPEIEKEAYEIPIPICGRCMTFITTVPNRLIVKILMKRTGTFWNQKTLPFMNMFMIFKPKRA